MTTAFDLGAMLSFGNNVQVRMIDCDLLVEYHNHKFSLYTGERLEDMVESIKANGIFTPLIVQPLGTKYEILIGHNRWNAAKLAGLTEVPCIVKTGLTEEEAEIYVIESNIMQRGFENLKISEQAEVLRIRYDSMFSQGKRNDIQRELIMLENGENPTSVPMETKLEKGKTSKDKVGEEYGISASSVARLLRITKLCDTIKEWVDNGEIAVRAAVNLSYLNLDEQELITYEDPKKLNMKVTSQLKDYAGVLDEETIDDIIRGKKENEE
ncbi:MAG: ParB N-terminal domain-containing protein, partial [Clostridia bacterium]|nr:ParB N-terminal domain-containing protein [Clostridia bacterium]